MKLKNLLYGCYLWPFKVFINADKEHLYFGCSLGSEINPRELERLHVYRMNFYKEHLPYLFPDTVEKLALEKAKDLRSYHIWATNRDGEIVGSCMMMPYPFEISHLLTVQKNKEFSNYLEISRLLVKKQRQGIGMRLLFQSGFMMIPHDKYKGIVGICRPQRLSMFKFVGMNEIGEITIKERESQHYKIIAASILRLSSIMNLLALKSMVFKNIKKVMFNDGQNIYAKVVAAFLIALISALGAAETIKIKDIQKLNSETFEIDSPSVSHDGSKICWVGIKRDLKLNERSVVFVKNLATGEIYDVKKNFVLNGDTRCHFSPDNALYIDEITYRPMAITRTLWHKYRTKDVEPVGFGSRITKIDVPAIEHGKRIVLAKYDSKDLELNSHHPYIKHAQISPDGAWMTYYISKDYPRDVGLYLINLNTRQNIQLSKLYDKHPTWSPDGTKILFHHQYEIKGQENAVIGYFDLSFKNKQFASATRILMEDQERGYFYQKHPLLDSKTNLLFFHGQEKVDGKKKLFVRKFAQGSKVYELALDDANGDKISKAKHPVSNHKDGIVFLGESKKDKDYAIYNIDSKELSKILKSIKE